MNWIYKTTKRDFDTDEVRLTDHLNNLGNDEWELISFFWKKQEVSSQKEAREEEHAGSVS